MGSKLLPRACCIEVTDDHISIGLDESIRVDVENIRSWRFLEKDTRVLGYAYEVETGRLRRVC